jgi:hypothetical protein
MVFEEEFDLVKIVFKRAVLFLEEGAEPARPLNVVYVCEDEFFGNGQQVLKEETSVWEMEGC